MNLKKEITVRALVVYFGAIFFALAVLGRIVFLQIVEGDKWAKKARTFSQKDIIIEPRRGDILAMDGRLLASSVPYYDIFFDAKTEAITDELFKNNVDSLALGLSKILKNKTAREYRESLITARLQGRRYMMIKRDVTYLQLKKIQKLPIFRRGKYKGGLIVEAKDKRNRPFQKLAQRTIGYQILNNSGKKVGYVGLERTFEPVLRGREGVCLMQRLSGGNWMPINNGQQVDPIDGKSVVTTIDVNLQDVAHNALLKALKKNEAQSGCAVLMETATGEVRAIVNLQLNKKGDDYNEAFNFAVGTRSEPGSTFKLISLLVALEEGLVDLDDSVDIEDGTTMYFDRKMKDSHQEGGVITVREAFERSSNVGISKIINQYYFNRKQDFANKLYQMRVNSKLGVDIVGEPDPDIKDPQDWSGTSLAWMSIGYELQLTPLQILAFYNAIANGGQMVKPRFARAIQENGTIVKRFKKEVLHPMICSESVLESAHSLLEGVVERGTARSIKTGNYGIAGKTGTSQIGYWNKDAKIRHQASFVGYFPSDAPRYSCIVVIANPTKGRIYGSDVAAPVFREIADKVYASNLDLAWASQSNKKQLTVPYCRNGYRSDLESVLSDLKLPYKGEKVTSDWIVTANKDSLVEIDNRIVDLRVVPNVKGMGLRDAMFLLERAGLKVTPIGAGAVRNQSVVAGTPVTKGREIIIELG